MKLYLIITILGFTLTMFSQNSATFKSSVGVCIVDINDIDKDTIASEVILPIIEIGMTYKYVVNNFNKPNEIIIMKNNKIKFIYDDCYIYFNNGIVDLIHKKLKF